MAKLSTGAKVGIGVGVSVAVIGAALGIAFGIDWSKDKTPPLPPPPAGPKYKCVDNTYCVDLPDGTYDTMEKCKAICPPPPPPPPTRFACGFSKDSYCGPHPYGPFNSLDECNNAFVATQGECIHDIVSQYAILPDVTPQSDSVYWNGVNVVVDQGDFFVSQDMPVVNLSFPLGRPGMSASRLKYMYITLNVYSVGPGAYFKVGLSGMNVKDFTSIDISQAHLPLYPGDYTYINLVLPFQVNPDQTYDAIVTTSKNVTVDINVISFSEAPDLDESIYGIRE